MKLAKNQNQKKIGLGGVRIMGSLWGAKWLVIFLFDKESKFNINFFFFFFFLGGGGGGGGEGGGDVLFFFIN